MKEKKATISKAAPVAPIMTMAPGSWLSGARDAAARKAVPKITLLAMGFSGVFQIDGFMDIV